MIADSLFRDIKIGLRALIKEKGFCTLAVIVLALGIAGVTTTFSVVNGVMVQNVLFGVSARDPLTYSVVMILITVVSLVATLVPAHRATRVDPMIALRAE
jgi:ABC-type lipoprotein release transport system permease subunit